MRLSLQRTSRCLRNFERNSRFFQQLRPLSDQPCHIAVCGSYNSSGQRLLAFTGDRSPTVLSHRFYSK